MSEIATFPKPMREAIEQFPNEYQLKSAHATGAICTLAARMISRASSSGSIGLWRPVCLQATGGNRRSFFGAGERWLPLPFSFFGSFTSQERNATQVKVREALTFAPCVNRLLVR